MIRPAASKVEVPELKRRTWKKTNTLGQSGSDLRVAEGN
jgi:hypothetical protein